MTNFPPLEFVGENINKITWRVKGNIFVVGHRGEGGGLFGDYRNIHLNSVFN